MVFHNAEFDRTGWNVILYKKYGFPYLFIDQTDCTSARAAVLNLPRSLDGIGGALGLAELKSSLGHDVIMTPGISLPRKPTKHDTTRWLSRDTAPELFARLDTYAVQDIRTTAELDGKVQHLSSFELAVFRANCRINLNGLRVDVALARRALELWHYEQRAMINTQLHAMTGGVVTKLTQLPAIKEWMREQKVEVGSLSESARARMLEDDTLPLEVAVVLELLDAHKASVKKLPTMLRTMSPDGRVRGVFRYAGAGQTLRFSGEKVQPQNLARPEKGIDQAVLRWELAHYNAHTLAHSYGSVANAITNAIRTFFIPEARKRFVAMDLSGIELRVLAWLAGDRETLADIVNHVDLYLKQAASLYGFAPGTMTKDKHPVERTMGKVITLGCGYQMGAAKFQATAFIQEGIEISLELAGEAVSSYRTTHPKQVGLWHDMGETAKEAMRNPGATYRCRCILFRCIGGSLQMRLPSGHVLYYWRAKLEMVFHPAFGKEIEQITYRNPKGFLTGTRLHTYGGKLTENAVQSIARHVLAEAMVKADQEGLPLVLHAHDELVAEVPIEDARATHDRLHELMIQRPAWAPDLPLSAEGWIGEFYQK